MIDKTQLFLSPLGMYSLLRNDYIISILNDDGSLNRNKLNTLIAAAANAGANALRDFCWIHSQEAYRKISFLQAKQNGLIEFRQQYYKDQRDIAATCNRYGIRYYLSLFDHCGTKKNTAPYNPWRYFHDFFYGTDAARTRHEHIDRILQAFDGLDVGLELCNEPKPHQAPFLAGTFIYLIRKGFDPRQIIPGIDYYLKEKGGQYAKDYREFRDAVSAALGNQWQKQLKTLCISPVHNAVEQTVDELWGDNVKPGGDRRILYSMDGVQPRPGKETMYRIVKKILEVKTRAREQGKVLFEVVLGKTKNDPLDSFEGLIRAYKETWGEYPVNRGKFPGPLPGETIDPYRIIITHAYRGILDREPDPAGLRAYATYLGNGGTIRQLAAYLFNSPEYRDKGSRITPGQLSGQLYWGILDRAPDPGGHRHTTAEIQAGRHILRASLMLQSPEFTLKFLTK